MNRFRKTIAAQIIAGFTLLIVVYGGISLFTMNSLNHVREETRRIRLYDVPLLLQIQTLAEKQEELWRHISKRTAHDSSMLFRLSSLRGARKSVLQRAEQSAADVDVLSVQDNQLSLLLNSRLKTISRAIDSTDAMYNAWIDVVEAKGDEGFALITQKERNILHELRDLALWQKSHVWETVHNLEDNADNARRWMLYLGLAAMCVGLLVTGWAIWTLRPIRILRNAARKIAQGDYSHRIEEQGPTEVVDLAREFNVMGAAIEERERELVRSERLAAVGRMASVINHEVRNPLASIRLNVELLEEEVHAQQEAYVLCRSVLSEVDRLTRITEEYLHIATMPHVQCSDQDLDQLLHETVAFEKERLLQKGINIHVALNLKHSVYCDASKIKQMLVNLIRNASEAIGRGGAISVESHHRNDTVEITIDDDGCGIEPAVVAQMFEPFFSTKSQGTGLGLGVARDIMRSHGGDIIYKDSKYGGACFVVIFSQLEQESSQKLQKSHTI